MADNGQLKDLMPPGNKGTESGTGQIEQNGTGEIFHFNTPKDNDGRELTVGEEVTFDGGDDGEARNVAPAEG